MQPPKSQCKRQNLNLVAWINIFCLLIKSNPRSVITKHIYLFRRLGYFLERKQMSWSIEHSFLHKLENYMSPKKIEWPILQNGEHTKRWKIYFLNSSYHSNSRINA